MFLSRREFHWGMDLMVQFHFIFGLGNMICQNLGHKVKSTLIHLQIYSYGNKLFLKLEIRDAFTVIYSK